MLEKVELGYEYKCKVFDTFAELTDFLNRHIVSKDEIIDISVYSRGVALIYLEGKEW